MYIVTSNSHHRAIIQKAHVERAQAFRKYFGFSRFAARTAPKSKVVTA